MPGHLVRASAGLALAAALVACGHGASPGPGTSAGRWTPRIGEPWAWQLTGTLDLAVSAVIFDVDLVEAPDAALASIHAAGHRVVCYFSAGTDEDWRPDHGRFAAADVGNAVDGWPGERWLDPRSANVRAVMKDRLALAALRGCDGVEPDNVDAYQNGPGFPLTAADQLDFNRFLAAEAHALGLAVALKNDVDQVAELEPDFDLALNEQCHEFDECGVYAAFTAKRKPVWNAEYASFYVTDSAGLRRAMCAAARAASMRTLVLPVALDGSFRISCD